MARLRILYFAWLRERTGCAEEALDVPDAVRTVAGLTEWLRRRDEAHEAAFAQAHLIRAAVNQEFASPDAAVADGDEVAFFPPVTGG